MAATGSMDHTETPGLSARILNCLQTVLELEPIISRLELGFVLLTEFKVLKSFLKNMETMELDENDVTRIEVATEHFLQELRTPLSLLQTSRENCQTLQ